MKIKSFAKINLGLEVVRKRPDGYHDIKTLFQWIDLLDILRFEVVLRPKSGFGRSDPAIPWDETNLIHPGGAAPPGSAAAPPEGPPIRVEKEYPRRPGAGRRKQQRGRDPRRPQPALGAAACAERI